MLVKREWIKLKPIFKGSSIANKYLYKGYFLFGIIPLYIERKGVYK